MKSVCIHLVSLKSANVFDLREVLYILCVMVRWQNFSNLTHALVSLRMTKVK